MQCKPTILGVADARHYLVGATDNDNNFIALPCLHTVAMCNSLPLAKQLLRDNDINVAQLTLESAYDEMCGLPTTTASTQTLYL
ncbi:MAG: hypothetical protein AXW17_04445 [Colwellia sp. Phe_37]|jgi:hypothetical protein|nr:MAG: hypothetical protein AXW17_04445 [Colwellia sp. Phe_37]|tara:strand:+ start:29276 stop:29527 length:252 start_codon:yes stop_codon:yes gene_type:complete